MINRYLDFCGNVFTAGLRVMIVSIQLVWAQENVNADAESSGEIKIPLTGTGMMLNGGSLSITPGRINAGKVEFATNFNGYTSLVSDQSVEVTMTFTPMTPGEKVAGLRLTISGSTTPYIVLLTGDAHYPKTSSLSITPRKSSLVRCLRTMRPTTRLY
jgi:hypothetical protein